MSAMLWPEPVISMCRRGASRPYSWGQELQHRVLLQPGEVVGLWRGQPRPGKVLLDDRGLPQGKALLLLDNQAGEGLRVLPYQLHQGADVLRLVGHAVEHLAVQEAKALWTHGGGPVRRHYDLTPGAAELGMVCGGDIDVEFEVRK